MKKPEHPEVPLGVEAKKSLEGEIVERSAPNEGARERRGRRQKERVAEGRAKLETLRSEQDLPRNENTAQVYIEKYLPQHIRPGTESLVLKAVREWGSLKERLGLLRVEGRERIPRQGAYLVISNHFGGETPKLLGVFDRLHIAAGEEVNWKGGALRRWVLRQLGMLSVQESLAGLDEGEKEKLIKDVPRRSRDAYRSILQKEKSGRVPLNKEFVHSAVATLLAGEPVGIFPEGLFLYKERELQCAYPGLELIVREYERVTGSKLPIVPVAIETRKVTIGEAVISAEGSRGITDAIMEKIASALPERMRGYYAKR